MRILAIISALFIGVLVAQPKATPSSTPKRINRDSDFIFTNPDEKTAKPNYVKAGEVFTLEWKVMPTSVPDPSVISLRLREGAWDQGGKFKAIETDIENLGYYEWQVPENAAPVKYFFEISTSDKTSGVRNRTSAGVEVYQGRNPIDILNSSPAAPVSFMAEMMIACLMALFFFQFA